MNDIPLTWDVSEYSIMVEVGEFVHVKKSNWGRNVGWIGAEIRVYGRQLGAQRARQVISELERAIEVARRLDANPDWRGD